MARLSEISTDIYTYATTLKECDEFINTRYDSVSNILETKSNILEKKIQEYIETNPLIMSLIVSCSCSSAILDDLRDDVMSDLYGRRKRVQQEKETIERQNKVDILTKKLDKKVTCLLKQKQDSKPRVDFGEFMEGLLTPKSEEEQKEELQFNEELQKILLNIDEGIENMVFNFWDQKEFNFDKDIEQLFLKTEQDLELLIN